MARIQLLLISVLLFGCAPAARTIELSQVDFSDMDAITEIKARLSPRDRSALATYTVKHLASSASFCGRPFLKPDGKAPATVGEAIDLTLAMEQAERRAEWEASRPRTDQEKLAQRWSELIEQRDQLIDFQTIQAARHGENAKRRSDWRESEKRLAALNRELLSLRPTGAAD